MDNYIALIEALSGFAPDSVTIEVLPGFESITGGGDANLLNSGEDLGLVNVDGNVGLINGDFNSPGTQQVEGGQSFTLTGDPVSGGQNNAEGNAVIGDGDNATAPLAQSGDGAAAPLSQVNNGDGDLNNPLGQTLREGLIGQGGLLNTGNDNGGLLGGGLGGLNLGL